MHPSRQTFPPYCERGISRNCYFQRNYSGGLFFQNARIFCRQQAPPPTPAFDGGPGNFIRFALLVCHHRAGNSQFYSRSVPEMIVHSRAKILIASILIFASRAAFAHEADAPQSFHALIRDWEFDPLVIAGLVLSACLYLRGVRRLWKVVGVNVGIKKWEAVCFGVGWLFTAIALVSPLHAWGEALFSAHMVQHEILMLIAAPLFVLGRPMIAFLKALSGKWAGQLARFGNSFWWQKFWRVVTYPLNAWIIH